MNMKGNRMWLKIGKSVAICTVFFDGLYIE